MTRNTLKPLSLVDSTYRIRLEVTKEEFDKCEFPSSIHSSVHAIEIDGKETEWHHYLYPKGKGTDDKNRNKVWSYLALVKGDEIYKVRFQFGIETHAGFWPHDFVNIIYSRGSYGDGPSCGYTRFFGDTEDSDQAIGKDENDYNENSVGYNWGYSLCKTEELSNHFVGDKLTIVASFTIYVEGESYRKNMKVADNFMDDIREMSSLENLTDFTIISNGVRFPCYRLLLAARSKYFEALFRNEPTKKEIEMDEPPEIVKTMLDFMCKGLTPHNLEDKAMDLMLMSDMYCLDLLTESCQTSLVDNLSPDNAVETLVMIDKVKRVSMLEHRQKVLNYIKNEADKVVKAKDWKVFVQAYPDLVTDIVLTLQGKPK